LKLAEKLLLFKKGCHSLELAAAFILFFRSFLKRTALGSIALFFVKGSNTRKIKIKSEFRNGQRRVSVNCAKLFHELSMSILLPALFNSEIQV
jgi:hypothetical protein